MVSIIDEQVEENLFLMLNEEIDSEIGKLVHTKIIQLLHIILFLSIMLEINIWEHCSSYISRKKCFRKQ